MGTITAGLFVSLDGVAEAPENWHFPYFDDAMGAVVSRLKDDASVTLLGRVTYEGFAEYFGPLTDDPFAKEMNEARKMVVSSTLTSADWQNSELLGSDWVERVTELKAQGTSFGVTGSLTLVRSLLAHGLLDELHLLVHPIVVGSGAKVFPDGTEQMPMALKSSETLPTGVLYVVYTPALASEPVA